MNNFRQNFVADAVGRLAALQEKLSAGFDDELRREAFRTIHTIKGTAQTFGLAAAAGMAGRLEDFLGRRAAFTDGHLPDLLQELDLLADSLRGGDQPGGIAPLDYSLPAADSAATELFIMQIPPAAFRKFTETERRELTAALRCGMNILCAEVGFSPQDFADGYRRLRARLESAGQVIAAIPGGAAGPAGQINFQIFFASRLEAAEIIAKMTDQTAQIRSCAGSEKAARELCAMLRQAAAHGRQIAERLQKNVNITILAAENDLPNATVRRLFEILLHLVRNAVDHAFDTKGEIEIRLWAETGRVHLIVSDNGGGIDPEQVRRRAIDKNLISPDEIVSEQDALDLIFAPELSTAEVVTEISGRGVGLDAVRSAAETAGGRIEVKSRKDLGTTFEVVLPFEEI